MNAWIILAIGFLAQIFFAARTLVQWIMSERARKVLSPSLFWILSIAGAYLLCIYGWLRDDFAIVLGQMISYYIYLWNLKMKGVWRKIRVPWRYFTLGLLVATPLVAITFVAGNAADFIDKFFRNADVPMWLLVFGSAGQVIFTLRFIYQWLYSMKKGESTLPLGFWVLSRVGSLTICSYGVIRLDPVLIVGQSFGLVAYIRNLTILLANRNKRNPISRMAK